MLSISELISTSLNLPKNKKTGDLLLLDKQGKESVYLKFYTAKILMCIQISLRSANGSNTNDRILCRVS